MQSFSDNIKRGLQTFLSKKLKAASEKEKKQASEAVDAYKRVFGACKLFDVSPTVPFVNMDKEEKEQKRVITTHYFPTVNAFAALAIYPTGWDVIKACRRSIVQMLSEITAKNDYYESYSEPIIRSLIEKMTR